MPHHDKPHQDKPQQQVHHGSQEDMQEVMQNDKRIRLVTVTKRWDDPPAVDGISFDVAPGQFVILLGPSGCGKSTTLRMVAGLEQASSGRIHIGERDVTDLPPGDRGISMVFQSYALFPHLSVADNIVFGLRSRKVPKPERRQRLERVAQLVDLEAFLDRKPAQLSGGQRQRVALARAIISEHPICLMDEPLSNLDARLRGEMRREIKALQERLGMTVIYVTHDQVEAMSMGDRVILMQDGRIVQDDTPDALYDRPASAFAASFIGSPAMNLVRLAAGADGAIIEGEPRVMIAEHAAVGGMLGIRPEDIAVTTPASPGVPAEVIDAEYLGADTILRLAVGSQVMRARLAGKPVVTKGSACRLAWPLDKSHLFAADGKRRDDLTRFPVARGDSEQASEGARLAASRALHPANRIADRASDHPPGSPR
ncbi:carbohydrate ABC transporter ATP-binding protein, CUT1 family (TC 3.A.1.1.-) [Halomonas korlensis]|uniref:Carbohydrate ABC transporter ATP-binding protein, CUT1 family (TC 3.A.1.1.-) n=2 Tax=Halomonas korlensis TaxID=463301 RepID=A0A1I7IUU3_9GAMM|nr:carbohydrate ABC transporter ATP-binding protein, CUT1 family (TC 3.A.1.1.-) [Halomonas korlensis]